MKTHLYRLMDILHTIWWIYYTLFDGYTIAYPLMDILHTLWWIYYIHLYTLDLYPLTWVIISLHLSKKILNLPSFSAKSGHIIMYLLYLTFRKYRTFFILQVRTLLSSGFVPVKIGFRNIFQVHFAHKLLHCFPIEKYFSNMLQTVSITTACSADKFVVMEVGTFRLHFVAI